MNSAVTTYIESIADRERKHDVYTICDVIERASGEQAHMWGTSIISFGLYSYAYESGRTGEAPKIGLSSRKNAMVIYGLNIDDQNHPNFKLLSTLGAHKTGKACLYITRLDDIDINVLQRMVRNCAI